MSHYAALLQNSQFPYCIILDVKFFSLIKTFYKIISVSQYIFLLFEVRLNFANTCSQYVFFLNMLILVASNECG